VKLREILHMPEEDGPGRIEGFVLEGGERLTADAYVAAVPAWALSRLMPASLREMAFFANIAALPVAPAISVQIWFDRPVVDTIDFTLVGRSLTPVYQDVGKTVYPNPRGSRLSVIVSPADDLLAHTDQQLVRLVLKSLNDVEPRVMHAGVVKSVVLRHKEHLIRPLPGAMGARPGQATPVPNLFLAGDWTQQPYFGSQEGAVRGGKAAAREIVRALSPGLRITWAADGGPVPSHRDAP
ncbi:MAG: FAD-dependent oxidoreductase, partial [Candidatus Sericytochromatia bacterium]